MFHFLHNFPTNVWWSIDCHFKIAFYTFSYNYDYRSISLQQIENLKSKTILCNSVWEILLPKFRAQGRAPLAQEGRKAFVLHFAGPAVSLSMKRGDQAPELCRLCRPVTPGCSGHWNSPSQGWLSGWAAPLRPLPVGPAPSPISCAKDSFVSLTPGFLPMQSPKGLFLGDTRRQLPLLESWPKVHSVCPPKHHSSLADGFHESHYGWKGWADVNEDTAKVTSHLLEFQS